MPIVSYGPWAKMTPTPWSWKGSKKPSPNRVKGILFRDKKTTLTKSELYIIHGILSTLWSTQFVFPYTLILFGIQIHKKLNCILFLKTQTPLLITWSLIYWKWIYSKDKSTQVFSHLYTLNVYKCSKPLE